jgi:DNA-binding response OmpR family regulator
MQLLLIEKDNLDHTVSLLPSLEADGYEVRLADTPDMAAQKVLTFWPNLIIFNPVSSDLNLADFQRAINETQLDVPYIIVGTKEQVGTPVSSDTILVAPAKLQQLSQSIEKAVTKQKNRFIRLPRLIIDCQQYKVLRNGKGYWLTPKEFKLLYLLVENQGQILKRKTIMQEIWETDYMGDTRTLDVHIRWIREKIEENPSQPRHLITVRGVGYRFVVNPESE